MSSPATATRPSLVSRALAHLDWRSNIIYIAFVVVFILFAIFLGNDGFLSPNNMLNIVRQTATISIMAVAMTFVIATAEIDLSVGSVAGLASVVTAMATAQFGLVPGILAGLLAGAVIGAVNGGLVALLKIPSFLVTLGMLGLAAGVSQWITASAPQPISDRLYVLIFGGGDFGPVPGLLVWTVVAVAVGWLVMNRTGYGRRVLATGGNPTAAAYTGINTARIKFTVLLTSGVAAALAGMLYAGRLESGRFQWGQGDELTVIAAVILGGTSLFGGRGAIIGTLFGSLFMGLVNNGLILAGLDVAQQQVVRGAIIIAAVALSRKK
ncbi:ABC transporter permease [Microbacterium sp. MEC084]|uniref:ABC transporter permease n=1 Tax=Microbacterium sp. MEC084 TaxID=1963027 RepID=UPI0010702838|nr:ABC transporter permease [Microbacterium sp. MEC084]MCD1268033.1 ABC transporter permease [Microbacterium sp. MEC084]